MITTKKNTLKVFLLMTLLISIKIVAQEDVSLLKTICIERFTRFIEWPEKPLRNNFNLVYIGDYDDPMKQVLESTFKSVNIKNHKVVFTHCKHIADLKKREIDILFISKDLYGKVDEILAFTANKPILTIGDKENFGEQGVLINFFLQQNKLKFEINEQAVKKSGLSVSFHLYKLAKVIQPINK